MSAPKDPYKYTNPTLFEQKQNEVTNSSVRSKRRVLRMEDHYFTRAIRQRSPSTSIENDSSNQQAPVQHHSQRRSHSPSSKDHSSQRRPRESYEDNFDDRTYPRHNQSAYENYTTSNSVCPKLSRSPDERPHCSRSPNKEQLKLRYDQRNPKEIYNTFEDARESSMSPYYQNQDYVRELELYSKQRSQGLHHYRNSRDAGSSHKSPSLKPYKKESPSFDECMRSSPNTKNYALEGEEYKDWDGKGSYAVHRLSKLIYNSPTYEEHVKSVETNSNRSQDVHHSYQFPDAPTSSYQFPPPYSPENMDLDSDDENVLSKERLNVIPSPVELTSHNTSQNMPRKNISLSHQNEKQLPISGIPIKTPEETAKKNSSNIKKSCATSQKIMPRLFKSIRFPRHMKLKPAAPQNTIPQLTGKNVKKLPPSAVAQRMAPQENNPKRKKKHVATRLIKITSANGKDVYIPPFLAMSTKNLNLQNQPVDTLKYLNLFSTDTCVV